MDRFKVLTLAGLMALGAVPAAHAADLLPPTPQFEPYPEPIESSGWYLRGDVGVGNTIQGKVSSNFAGGAVPPGFTLNERHLDDSALAGIGVGYEFNNWFRADITGEYRTSARFQAIESAALGGGTSFDTYNGSVQSSVVLANGYVDFGHWHGFTPYIGAGIGGAFNQVASLTDIGAGATGVGAPGNGGLGFAPTKSSTSLAWALMAGVSFDVTHNLKLDISYRYLNMGDAQSGVIACTTACVGESQKYHLASNDIRIGARWMFGGEEAPPPPPPLITKY
ncbi:MAG TPA: outer membrane beta-barrel protein [Beijerinckiaceae bacterium]|jgi:opacity protein-like surface antigen|nr:outer membrane beta-barrel protein [Beijerinckiaceae bacterium]